MIFHEDSIQLELSSLTKQDWAEGYPHLALAFRGGSAASLRLMLVVLTFCMVAYKTEYVYSDGFINSHTFFNE